MFDMLKLVGLLDAPQHLGPWSRVLTTS